MASSKKKRAFTEEETSVLLDLWADDRIQAKFNNSFRHNLIWEDIALRMRGMGYNRSWKECYNRVGNLKKIFARKKRDFETGVVDATDWTYWSHLESLFKSIPSSTQYVNEDDEAEDFSDQFFKLEETVCDDDYEEEEDEGEKEEIIINDTASQVSDSFAVLMEDIDEDDDDDDDDDELGTLQPQVSTTSIPVQPLPSPIHNAKKKPVLKKSKRRAHSDDYYIKQLIENDKQMLRNQQRQLQLDEQVSTAAVQFFNVMTEYLNKMNSTMQTTSDVLTTEPECSARSSSPSSKHSSAPAPGCSKIASDVPSEESDSEVSRTMRVVKKLCTTDISQNLKCNGINRRANRVIALPQEGEIN